MEARVKVVRLAPVSMTVVTTWRELRCGVARTTLAWDCGSHNDLVSAEGSASTSSSASSANGECLLLLLRELAGGDGGGVIVAVRCGVTGCHGWVSDSNDEFMTLDRDDDESVSQGDGR